MLIKDNSESSNSPSATPPPDRSDCHQDPPVSMSCQRKKNYDLQAKPLTDLHAQKLIREQKWHTKHTLIKSGLFLFVWKICIYPQLYMWALHLSGCRHWAVRSPYDVGCSFPFLGQKFRIMHHLLQETNNLHFQLSVGIKVLHTQYTAMETQMQGTQNFVSCCSPQIVFTL